MRVQRRERTKATMGAQRAFRQQISSETYLVIGANLIFRASATGHGNRDT